MSEDEINEIEARANAASDAPWKTCGASDGKCSCGNVFGDNGAAYLCSMTTVNEADPAYTDGQRIKNATFIAHARTDIPKLIAALREARSAAAEADNQ